MQAEVEIHYLYNSGFAVETENHLMIFDYYIDAVDKGEKCIENGAIGTEDLKTNKKILVFVSHRHQDHLNPVIFEWSKMCPSIHYILGNDIKKRIECDGTVHKLKAYQELCVEDAHIRAFGSTDAGVSYLVSVDGIHLFHAGDLNWWHWYDATEKENKQAAGRFKAEIKRIGEHNIDLAFFPVDKRLREAYCLGATYFVENMKPDLFVPMHFGNAYEATGEFAEEIAQKGIKTKVAVIDHRGQKISYQIDR